MSGSSRKQCQMNKKHLYHTVFYRLSSKKAFEHIAGKGEIADSHFHLPPTYFPRNVFKGKNHLVSNINVFVCKCFQFVQV